jgi:hypothetical protein
MGGRLNNYPKHSSVMQEFVSLPSLSLLEKQKLPEFSAIYFAVARDQVLYVGLATNLRSRWQNHHRFPQLSGINKRSEVKVFWLNCPSEQLNELEQQYILHYCPILNQTKVPRQKITPSFQLLTLSLNKLSDRILGLGVSPANNHHLKTLFLGYLANLSEIRSATTTLRKTLQAITNKPNSLFRWTEVIRRKEGAQWRTRCNGIEIWLMPCIENRIMHNSSMYSVMKEKCFGNLNSIPLSEYESMKHEVKMLSRDERITLARQSETGQRLFPLECGADFRTVSGVKILCLTDSQLSEFLSRRPHLQEQYPVIQSIGVDPVQRIEF